MHCPAEARYAGIDNRPFATRLLRMCWLNPSDNYINVFIWWASPVVGSCVVTLLSIFSTTDHTFETLVLLRLDV